MSELMQSMVSAHVIENAAKLADSFAGAQPFRHVAIDGFFSAEAVESLVNEFPDFDEKLALNENGQVGNKAVNEKVTSLGPAYQALDQLVQSEAFRGLIGQITRVPDLQYDPHYFGGGTHENRHGQGLDAHVDFNFHPITRQHRRLNLIFYLTQEWEDAWGGSIQLHKDPYLPPAQDEIAVLTPLFNRCVIFETNEYSWHGFPQINLPEHKRDLSRKSFALYYYTDTRPEEELGKEHSTIYVEQHLPENYEAGMTLSAEQLQHVRNLLASRDQHLKRLYGNIKDLNDELNGLKERMGLQPPPGVAAEPPEPEPTHESAPGQDAQTADDGPGDDGGAAQRDLERLVAKVQRREAEVARLSRRVAELETSTSWKITRPMRGLKRLLGGG